MTEVSRLIDAPAEAVFAVLADGWSFGGWVVGASHIRDVDAGWPAPGTSVHHSIGPWPLHVQDQTTVAAMVPDRSLELQARAMPLGAAEIGITLEPAESGQTLVTMTERAVGGPAKLLPEVIQKLVLRPRNIESLARLADMARGRAAHR